MTEPTRDELMRRIEQLERANRRWRRGSFVVTGLLAIGLVALMAEHYRQVTNARQRAELARQQAEHALEHAIQDAEELMKDRRQPTPFKLYDGLGPVRPTSQPHFEPVRPPWNLYDGARIRP